MWTYKQFNIANTEVTVEILRLSREKNNSTMLNSMQAFNRRREDNVLFFAHLQMVAFEFLNELLLFTRYLLN